MGPRPPYLGLDLSRPLYSMRRKCQILEAALSGPGFDEANFAADREDASHHLLLHEAEAHG